MKKIGIIGAGASGLSAGIHLAKSGFDVTIYEKNPYAGGFIITWKRKNTLIDGCMHWMLGTKEGTPLNTFWKSMNALGDVIHPESFNIVEYNGRTFHFYRDIEKLEAEMYSYSENDDEEIQCFIEAVKSIGIMELPLDMYEENMESPITKEILRKVRSYLKISVHELAMRFHSDILRYAFDNCLLNRYYSAFYFIQTMSNFTNGNDSIPVGCSETIRKGMLDTYLSYGGKIVYNSPVDEILVENGIARGIRVRDNTYTFDYVISAADLHYTEDVLLKGAYGSSYKEFDQDHEKYPAYSFCIASYRTKKDFTGLDIAVVKNIPKFDIMGISSDVLSIRQYGYDKTLISPEGYSCVQVYLTTREKDYETIKSFSREEYKEFKRRLGELYLPYLEEYYQDSFELIDVLTPLTYERYNHSYMGTFMPYALGPKVQQIMRPQKVAEVSNLYYASQWIMMPGGVCVAAIIGKYAAQQILHEEGMDVHI